MEDKRSALLEKMKLKDQLEEEVKELHSYLTGSGMPGLKGGLVDAEGFPIFDAEKLISVKTARGDYARKQNDYTAAMKEIDRLTQEYFASNEPKEIKEYKPKSESSKSESSSTSSSTPQSEEELSYQTLKPLALVKEVTPGSPSHSAGLFNGDLILKYGSLTMKENITPDAALKSIGEITLSRKGAIIPILIQRNNSGIEFKKPLLNPSNLVWPWCSWLFDCKTLKK